MQRAIPGFFALLLAVLTGCQSPPFAYPAPPARLSSAGPSIVIMPLTDARTNLDMDKVLAKGYLTNVQNAIGSELQSMNYFRSVIVLTNTATIPPADLQLWPTLERLEWEIPNYQELEEKAFAIALLTGGVGGAIYASTGIDVYGHSTLDVVVNQTTNAIPVFNCVYTDTVTNRLKKAVCDTPKTQASMMVHAFQKTMLEVKADVQKHLSPPAEPQVPVISEQK